MSSGEIHVVDPDRSHEVDRRHQRLAEFLAETDFNGLLLTRPHNLAWLTVGGDPRRGDETRFAAFVTPEARVIIASNVDSSQLFDRELNGLGFQLKERPWHEPREVLCQDLCRGRSVASDNGIGGTPNVDSQLLDLRTPLMESEWSQLRALGRALAHAVEATARQFSQGDTEAEVAGQLAHRLLRHQINPVRLQVMADGQGHRYRHWSYGADRIERTCVVSAVGTRHGLHAGVSRTVTFGTPTQSILDTHHLASIIQLTGMYFSQADWRVSDVWARVARIYEKYDVADEWREADQAEIIGYRRCEVPIVPNIDRKLPDGTPVFWHPSVRTAFTGDTILVRNQGFELITPGGKWPQMDIEIKGKRIQRPDILVRESGSDWPEE
jgi:Xaa-Pro dipeptidase